MAKKTPNPFLEQCRQVLAEYWNAMDEKKNPLVAVPDAIVDAIERSVNSDTRTYRREACS